MKLVQIKPLNYPDTGNYDLEHEEHMRPEVVDWAQYAEAGPSYDPAGDYLCGTCDMRWGTNECTRVEGSVNFNTGGCKLYRYGQPEEGGQPMPSKLSKEETKYSERPLRPGFGCKNCEYGSEADAPDDDGRPSWCGFWGMHVIPDACCEQNESGDDMTFDENDNILVYFFRHGETEANKDNKFRGFMDVLLDDKGQSDAEESGELVKNVPFAGFYCSDLKRAQQTMQSVLDRNVNRESIKVETAAAGRPWNVGIFAGMEKTNDAKALLQEFANNPDIPVPEGESLSEFRARFGDLFNRVIAKAKECGTMGIFGHASNGHEIGNILYNDIDVLDSDPGGVVVIYERDGKLEACVVKNAPSNGKSGFGSS